MEEAIIALLLDASPGVTSLVGNRVWPQDRPQGSALPAVVVHGISGGPIYTDSGESGLFNHRLQFNCFGRTYAEAKTVSRAVGAILSAYVGTKDGVDFQYVLRDDERDLHQEGNAKETLFCVASDYQVWWNKA